MVRVIGETWGPTGSAPFPSSSVPDGALRDTQALLRSVGWESGRVSGFAFRLTALLRVGRLQWPPQLALHSAELYTEIVHMPNG